MLVLSFVYTQYHLSLSMEETYRPDAYIHISLTAFCFFISLLINEETAFHIEQIFISGKLQF